MVLVALYCCWPLKVAEADSENRYVRDRRTVFLVSCRGYRPHSQHLLLCNQTQSPSRLRDNEGKLHLQEDWQCSGRTSGMGNTAMGILEKAAILN